eukprot:CAMPEP_0185265994 /NCGR_PEP_ID=MMETSP1359-20130426/29536_1 /TAXON_ID=552665 /ORGANISM="Bigelowiella longifila, Strain CCMP242" /LENGTH=255 /DNA_ID=CAMNT_0027855573 /DNA_START=62 /DNA_END=826 /DNA_ORIENTATION=-
MNWSLANAMMEPDVYQTWRATPMVKLVIPTQLTRHKDGTWNGESARNWGHSWGGNSSREEHTQRQLENGTVCTPNNITSEVATNAGSANAERSTQPTLLGIPPRPSQAAPPTRVVRKEFSPYLAQGLTTSAAGADKGNYTMVKMPSTLADLSSFPATSFERVEATWAIVTGWTNLDEVEGRICELVHQLFVPWLSLPIDLTKNLRFCIRCMPKLLQVIVLWAIGAYLLAIRLAVYVILNFPRLVSKELSNLAFAW